MPTASQGGAICAQVALGPDDHGPRSDGKVPWWLTGFVPSPRVRGRAQAVAGALCWASAAPLHPASTRGAGRSAGRGSVYGDIKQTAGERAVYLSMSLLCALKATPCRSAAAQRQRPGWIRGAASLRLTGGGGAADGGLAALTGRFCWCAEGGRLAAAP